MEHVTRADATRHLLGSVAVITPTIEGREELLVEATQSVLGQTVEVSHHIIPDVAGQGPAMMRQLILDHITNEWVAFLDDDDLMDADHIETLAAAINEQDADLAFSWYRRVGDAPDTPRVDTWDDWCYGTMLGGRNLIPVTVLARREAILDAGGFDSHDRFEDYSLFMRMLERGCRIAVVPRETWTYRCIGENRTWLT